MCPTTTSARLRHASLLIFILLPRAAAGWQRPQYVASSRSPRNQPYLTWLPEIAAVVARTPAPKHYQSNIFIEQQKRGGEQQQQQQQHGSGSRHMSHSHRHGQSQSAAWTHQQLPPVGGHHVPRAWQQQQQQHGRPDPPDHQGHGHSDDSQYTEPDQPTANGLAAEADSPEMRALYRELLPLLPASPTEEECRAKAVDYVSHMAPRAVIDGHPGLNVTSWVIRFCRLCTQLATVSPPDGVYVTTISKSSVAVQWQPVAGADEYLIKYMREPRQSGRVTSDWEQMNVDGNSQNATIDGLISGARYDFCVASVRDSRTGECGKHFRLERLQVLFVVKEFVLDYVTHERAHVIWKYDNDQPQPVNFTLDYTGEKEFFRSNLTPIVVRTRSPVGEARFTRMTGSRSFLFDPLRPYTNYTLNIRVNHNGRTHWPVSLQITTSTSYPPLVPAPIPLKESGVGSSQVKLRLTPAAEENGPISHYWLVVVPYNYSGLPKTISNAQLRSNVGPNKDGSPLIQPYVAKNISRENMNSAYKENRSTLMGSGTSVDIGFYDAPLDPRQKYKTFVRAFVATQKDLNRQPPRRDGDPTDELRNWEDSAYTEPFSPAMTKDTVSGSGSAIKPVPPSSAWLIGPVIVILIILAMIAMLVIYWMKRNRKKQPGAMMRHGSISKVQLGPSPNETSKLLMSDGYPVVAGTQNTIMSPYEPAMTQMNGGGGVHGAANTQHMLMPYAQQHINDPNMEMAQMGGMQQQQQPIGQTVYPGTAGTIGGHPPIPITELAAHIERLKANDNLLFFQEYESIETGQTFTWEASNMECNKPKNRYANVVAYDHSRVKLTPMDASPGADYINANYIDGYRKPKAYIATQGPMPETFADFWRMVWEENSVTIVMLTKLEERTRVKCDQYWPTRGSYTYGLVTVTLADTLDLAHYTIRTLRIQKRGDNDVRDIRHLQFTAWPDHGVPDHPTPFLMFLKRVKSLNPPEAGPVVTHCSAGIGRTGALIAIDCMLDRLRFENTVDIYGCVTALRTQRSYMVQTEDQYVFIHDAVLDAIQSGSTEVPASKLYTHIQALMQIQPLDNASGMQLEFRHLAALKMPNARFTAGNQACNKPKNRLVNILPYDSTRLPHELQVCLSPQPHVAPEGTDYINASWIDAYRCSRSYIATQGPLQNTVDDFWRMLWEHNSCIIVMLTNLREMGREKCYQYWPGERSQRLGNFVLEPIAEYNMPQYVLREFKMTDTQSGQSRTIRHFQYTEWPEQGSPKSGELFVEFVGQVHKTKEQFGADGPITAHCSTGVGRTGVFITLSIVLERMRYENVVDIFTTVKLLRTQRPNMVQSEVRSCVTCNTVHMDNALSVAGPVPLLLPGCARVPRLVRPLRTPITSNARR